MRLHHVTLAPLLLLLAVSQFAAADDADRVLQGLRAERRQVLQELVKLATLRFDQGEGTWESVMTARRNLLDAELEMAATPKARVALREAHVRLLEEYEQVIAARVEQGDAPRALLLEARSDRLRARIELVKEKQAG